MSVDTRIGQCSYPSIGLGSVTGRARRARPPLAFCLAFAATLTVALLQDARPFYYDADAYWNLGATFTDGDGFSLLNFESPVRGYLLPLTTLGLGNLASALDWGDVATVKVFNSLVFALIATLLAPRLAELAWPRQRWGLWPRLALALLLVVFWGGHLGVPLSDFPALALALVTLIAIARSDSLGWMLVAGVAAGAAVNLRPAYLLLPPIAAAMIALSWLLRRDGPDISWRRRVLVAGLFVAGFALVSLPQSLSTHRHYGMWSFVPGTAADLSNFQLAHGLRMQRYDTFVGGDGSVPARLVYAEPTGLRLLEQENWTIDGVSQYLGIVVDHPIAMSGVFVRHIVNGLDHRHDGPYVETYAPNANRPVRMAGFLLVFLAAARLAWPAARRALGPAHWRYPAALLLCGLPAVTSAVETRFLLPVFLACAIAVLTPGWTSPMVVSSLRRRRYLVPAVLLGAYALSMAMALYVTDQASDHLAR